MSNPSLSMESTTPTQTSPQADVHRLESKIDAIYRSVEQTRRYFLYTLIGSMVMVVLPIIGLLFVIPMFIETLSSFGGAGVLEGL